MKPKQLIFLFAFVKLLIHLIFNTQYGLHRDEYLYFAEGQHLGWGYMEGPPMIALIAKLANIFGESAFMLRLFPTLAGVASIIIIGYMVLELGGKKWAVFFACLAFLISPNYLRSNMLFQPVSFNQFFWLLSLFLVVLIAHRRDHRLWYILGIVIGLGLLTKYSILSLLLPLFIFSLLFKDYRKWFSTRYPYIAMGIALVMVLPNIYWQFVHNFPVAEHMASLSSSQLVNVSPTGFIRDQFLFHLTNSLIWVAGLLYLFMDQSVRKFRIIGWSFLGMIAVLILLSGKSYYSMGAYSTLFVFGGLAIEKYLTSDSLKYGLAIFLLISLVPFSPYALPVLSMNKMKQYCAFMDDKLGLDAPIIWEDGKKYPIPQDYADMRGWEDMVRRVSAVYHSLPEGEQATCNIWGGSYGHAGAINFYRKKYDLPEAVSLSASFMIWCPEENDFSVRIEVDDQWHSSSSFFEELIFIDSSEVPLARDPGYIFLKRKPKVDVPETWRKAIREEKSRFNFNRKK